MTISATSTRLTGRILGFIIRWRNQRRGLSASQVVDEACRAAAEPDVQFWALFDHDGRRDIDQVCARARRCNVTAALSHPAFELWLLLHFREFAPAAQDGSNTVIMERLRAAHPAFADYRDGDKRIDRRRFDALHAEDRIRAAADRARRLAANFTYQTPSNRDPSTDLYLLVEDLGIVPRPR